MSEITSRENTAAETTDLDFDSLTLVELPVKYKGNSYILREADERAARAYRNALLSCMTLGPDGKPQTLKNLADVEPLLVSLCLFDARGKLVPKAIIETWPSRMVKKLFDKAKAISDLNEESAERKAFLAALKRTDTPVSLDTFREWANALPKSEFEALQRWLKPTEEEAAKNALSDTTIGSE